MFFRNYLLQITSSVLLLIFTLQKENFAASEGLQSMLYPFLMFTSLWMSHCFVTSVFKCADVISPGILHRVRHATIIWDDQHISHKRSSKEERLTYMHNFLFSSCFPAFCQCQQRKLLSFYSSQLPYHHCFAASGVFRQYLMVCTFICTSRSESASFSQHTWLFHHSSLTHQWHPCYRHPPILLYPPRVF